MLEITGLSKSYRSAGETVAGYPAVKRMKWLRGLAQLYRGETT